MNQLFEVNQHDRDFYRRRLQDFLPERIIDMHTHVWKKAHSSKKESRTRVAWPSLVAAENPVEDLIESYRLMFPGKTVTPLMFSLVRPHDDERRMNEYVRECAKDHGFPALLFAHPDWDGKTLESRIRAGGFRGVKVYYNLVDPCIPQNEVRIFDYLPPRQLDVLNRNGWIAMLHIPRDDRLRDPLNLAQLLEIEKNYPCVKLIVAHVGRAYCESDIGDAFERLKTTRHMRFDITANTNAAVFERAIRTFGPRRILFGSDLPIVRMRMRRICENGSYVNLVPPGLYGDLRGVPHMRAVSAEEGRTLTFFMYEEIDAFRRAAQRCGLSADDVRLVFHDNAKALIDDARSGESPAQLSMVHDMTRVPSVALPRGYILRTCKQADKTVYRRLLRLAGFGKDDPGLAERNIADALPGGLFFVVHKRSGAIVATALAGHRPSALHPNGGELGWVAADPAHVGKKLGAAVCAAVMKRFAEAGYTRVYLLTDDFRLPAIKTYLRLGFRPLLHQAGMARRWRTVCRELGMDYHSVAPLKPSDLKHG
ncbi:MAG: GNAT family N-acetyltransferase [Chitinivibrionales bacterium]|nr:GNAT family N-acetyltransferase [Chitinivibrionales bacterium]